MFRRVVLVQILAIFALIGADFAESTANAGFLKNGVRPGNRSKMNIVRRPSSNARKRIFAPGERQRQQQETGKRSKKGKRYSQQHAWFWKTHSPGLASANPVRWAQALATMQKRREAGQGIVSEARVAEILSTYRSEITAAAREHRVSEALLVAVITTESLGKSKAVSHKGAQGLMQLIPATARRFGVTNAFDAKQNIAGGATYLSWLLNEFGGDPLLALAGYNAGEGAVRKKKGVPPYAETRDYVVKVMDAVAAVQAVCPEASLGPRVRCSGAPAGI